MEIDKELLHLSHDNFALRLCAESGIVLTHGLVESLVKNGVMVEDELDPARAVLPNFYKEKNKWPLIESDLHSEFRGHVQTKSIIKAIEEYKAGKYGEKGTLQATRPQDKRINVLAIRSWISMTNTTPYQRKFLRFCTLSEAINLPNTVLPRKKDGPDDTYYIFKGQLSSLNDTRTQLLVTNRIIRGDINWVAPFHCKPYFPPGGAPMTYYKGVVNEADYTEGPQAGDYVPVADPPPTGPPAGSPPAPTGPTPGGSGPAPGGGTPPEENPLALVPHGSAPPPEEMETEDAPDAPNLPEAEFRASQKWTDTIGEDEVDWENPLESDQFGTIPGRDVNMGPYELNPLFEDFDGEDGAPDYRLHYLASGDIKDDITENGSDPMESKGNYEEFWTDNDDVYREPCAFVNTEHKGRNGERHGVDILKLAPRMNFEGTVGGDQALNLSDGNSNPYAGYKVFLEELDTAAPDILWSARRMNGYIRLLGTCRQGGATTAMCLAYVLDKLIYDDRDKEWFQEFKPFIEAGLLECIPDSLKQPYESVITSATIANGKDQTKNGEKVDPKLNIMFRDNTGKPQSRTATYAPEHVWNLFTWAAGKLGIDWSTEDRKTANAKKSSYSSLKQLNFRSKQRQWPPINFAQEKLGEAGMATHCIGYRISDSGALNNINGLGQCAQVLKIHQMKLKGGPKKDGQLLPNAENRMRYAISHTEQCHHPLLKPCVSGILSNPSAFSENDIYRLAQSYPYFPNSPTHPTMIKPVDLSNLNSVGQWHGSVMTGQMNTQLMPNLIMKAACINRCDYFPKGGRVFAPGTIEFGEQFAICDEAQFVLEDIYNLPRGHGQYMYTYCAANCGRNGQTYRVKDVKECKLAWYRVVQMKDSRFCLTPRFGSGSANATVDPQPQLHFIRSIAGQDSKYYGMVVARSEKTQTSISTSRALNKHLDKLDNKCKKYWKGRPGDNPEKVTCTFAGWFHGLRAGEIERKDFWDKSKNKGLKSFVQNRIENFDHADEDAEILENMRQALIESKWWSGNDETLPEKFKVPKIEDDGLYKNSHLYKMSRKRKHTVFPEFTDTSRRRRTAARNGADSGFESFADDEED